MTLGRKLYSLRHKHSGENVEARDALDAKAEKSAKQFAKEGQKKKRTVASRAKRVINKIIGKESSI